MTQRNEAEAEANRAANIARSDAMRCPECARINCPNPSHLRAGLNWWE